MQKTKWADPWRRVGLTTAAALLVVALIAIYVYFTVGDLGLSINGYIALVLGAVVTALLTAGLISLMFFSARRGYDDAAGHLPERPRIRMRDRGDGQ